MPSFYSALFLRAFYWFLILSLLKHCSLSQTLSFLSLVLPHNLGIISLPFSSRCLRLETHLLSVKLQGFVVGDCGHEARWWFGDCGHDLVGIGGASVTVLMGLRSGWWVLVGVEIRVGFVVGGGFCGGCWYWGKARLGYGGGVRICRLWVALMVVQICI